MKRIILSLAVLGVVTLSAFAGPQDKGPQRKKMFEIPKELNLSADQQKKLESLNTEFKAQLDEMMKNLDQLKGKQDELKGLAEKHQKAINDLLTPEQMEKWKEMMPKFGKMRQFDARDKEKDFFPKGDSLSFDNRRYNKGPGHFEKEMLRHEKKNLFDDLKLTDDQKKAVRELKEKFRTQKKELEEKQRSDIEKILTPEQQALLKEKREKFKMED